MSKTTLSMRLLAALGVNAEAPPPASTEAPAADAGLEAGGGDADLEAPPEDTTGTAELEALRVELKSAQDSVTELTAKVTAFEVGAAEVRTTSEALVAENTALTTQATELTAKVADLEAQLQAAKTASEGLEALSGIVQTMCKNMTVNLGGRAQDFSDVRGTALAERFTALNKDVVARFPVGGVAKTDAEVVDTTPATRLDSRSQRAIKATNLGN